MLDNIKPIVHYVGTPEIFTDFNGQQRAHLTPVDHPDTVNVSNNHMATTSAIVSMNADTGRIETRNTVYCPKGE